MILYHFTTTQNLLLISWTGLKPDALGKCRTVWQTAEPCVWLTRQESNTATVADMEHFAKLGLVGDPDLPCQKIGDPTFGGPERLAVKLERHDRKLVPYRDIAPAEVLSLMMPYARLSWWCYFGDIPPNKIGPITAAQAIAGLDIQIDIQGDAKDYAAQASYMRMRGELLRGGKPDALVAWNLQ